MAPSNRPRALNIANAGMSLLLIATLVLWFMHLFPADPFSSPIELVEGETFQSASPSQLPRRDAGGIHLLFAGDVMQHRGQANDDFAASYAGIREKVRAADLAVLNLEFPVVPSRPIGPGFGTVQFNGSTAHIQALKEAGFDILVTANNHSYDQGMDGIISTLKELQAAGLEPVGTARSLEELREPRLFDAGPLKVGIYAYAYTVNFYADDSGTVSYPPPDLPVFSANFSDWQGVWRDQGRRMFAAHVEAARRAGADFLIAYCHWGAEWHFRPSPDQIQAAQDLVDEGFDLVVGSHSHVLQGTEIYRGKLIAYGLGTLNSDFRPWQTRTSALLEVVVTKPPVPAVVDFRFYPTLVEREGHRVTILGSKDEEMGERLAARKLSERILGDAVVGLQEKSPESKQVERHD